MNALLCAGLALAVDLAEPVKYGLYFGGTTTLAAFDDAIAPGTSQLFGMALGGTMPFGEPRADVSLHFRLELGAQIGPPPAELATRLPAGFGTGPYLGLSSWVGAMATGRSGYGPYLEVGGMLVGPAGWHPEFDGLDLFPGLASGGRLVFGQGLLVDAGVRLTTVDPKPGGSSFPFQAYVAVGGGLPW